MRIAISGTHVSGKTTLVEALSEALPPYSIVEEPYALLQEEGHEFSESPAIEDFKLQLERSIKSLDESAPDTLFDRCPADFLGYLLVHRDADAFDLDAWLPRVRTAIDMLDLIVFIPVEEPDRIVLPASEDASYRLVVDEKLKEIIVENSFGFDVDMLEVSGGTRTRINQVIAYIRGKAGK